MKDTKLIGNYCILKSIGENSIIQAKRIRTDDCQIRAINGNINIGSYIEAGVLDIETD